MQVAFGRVRRKSRIFADFADSEIPTPEPQGSQETNSFLCYRVVLLVIARQKLYTPKIRATQLSGKPPISRIGFG